MSNSDKLKVFIAPNMKDLIILFEKKGKLAICTYENIYGICHYLGLIVAPTNLTYFGHQYHPYINSSSTKNNKASPQTVIAFFCIIKNITSELCIKNVHKTDSCTICGPKFLSPVLIEIWTNRIHFIATKQLNLWDSGVANKHRLT